MYSHTQYWLHALSASLGQTSKKMRYKIKAQQKRSQNKQALLQLCTDLPTNTHPTKDHSIPIFSVPRENTKASLLFMKEDKMLYIEEVK